jgi:hypothetical protein
LRFVRLFAAFGAIATSSTCTGVRSTLVAAVAAGTDQGANQHSQGSRAADTKLELTCMVLKCGAWQIARRRGTTAIAGIFRRSTRKLRGDARASLTRSRRAPGPCLDSVFVWPDPGGLAGFLPPPPGFWLQQHRMVLPRRCLNWGCLDLVSKDKTGRSCTE